MHRMHGKRTPLANRLWYLVSVRLGAVINLLQQAAASSSKHLCVRQHVVQGLKLRLHLLRARHQLQQASMPLTCTPSFKPRIPASKDNVGVARSTCLQCCSAAVRQCQAVIVPSQLVVEVIGVTQAPTVMRPHAKRLCFPISRAQACMCQPLCLGRGSGAN